MLRAAVEQFIDKEPKEIEDVAMSTLEGHQVTKEELLCSSVSNNHHGVFQKVTVGNQRGDQSTLERRKD